MLQKLYRIASAFPSLTMTIKGRGYFRVTSWTKTQQIQDGTYCTKGPEPLNHALIFYLEQSLKYVIIQGHKNRSKA